MTDVPDSVPDIVPVTVSVVGSDTAIDTAPDTVVDTVPDTGVAPVPVDVPVTVPIVHDVVSYAAPDTVDLPDAELAAHDALSDTAPDDVDVHDTALAAIDVVSLTALDALYDALTGVDAAALSSAVPDAVSDDVPAAVPTDVSAAVPDVASAAAHDTEPDVLIGLEPAATADALPHAGTVPTVTGLTDTRTTEVVPSLGLSTVVVAPPSASTCNALARLGAVIPSVCPPEFGEPTEVVAWGHIVYFCAWPPVCAARSSEGTHSWAYMHFISEGLGFNLCPGLPVPGAGQPEVAWSQWIAGFRAGCELALPLSGLADVRSWVRHCWDMPAHISRENQEALLVLAVQALSSAGRPTEWLQHFVDYAHSLHSSAAAQLPYSRSSDASSEVPSALVVRAPSGRLCGLLRAPDDAAGVLRAGTYTPAGCGRQLDFGELCFRGLPGACIGGGCLLCLQCGPQPSEIRWHDHALMGCEVFCHS